MRFTETLQLKKIAGLLDSEESVRKARISLEKSTEEAYKEFERAKHVVQEEADRKPLD